MRRKRKRPDRSGAANRAGGNAQSRAAVNNPRLAQNADKSKRFGTVSFESEEAAEAYRATWRSDGGSK